MCAEENQTRASRPFSLNPTGTLSRRVPAQFVCAVDTTPYIMTQTTETMISAYLKREIKHLGGRRLPREMGARDFVLKQGDSVKTGEQSGGAISVVLEMLDRSSWRM
jgi:hypothetical protein